MKMETQPTPANEDQTFDRLRRLSFPDLEARLSRISDGHYAIMNAQTFEYKVARPYFGVITSAGWTVDEFNAEINNVLDRYKNNDNK